MQTATSNARPDMPATTPAHTPLLLRALNWIADADYRFRQKQTLQNMPEERLEDMGMTRNDADTAFNRRNTIHPR